MKKILNIAAFWAVILAATALLFGRCAREVTPTGGLRDSLPPVILRMKPENKTVNFNSKKVVLQFDEYISLKAVSENLLISPPSEPKPEIKQSGKRIIIDFSKCNLADSTTYSLNFGSSIADLNESNVLSGFNYIFSTGPDIDSLHIQGRVKDVQTGILLEGITAALYADLADSAPIIKIPNYIAKTDKTGSFLFNTVKQGAFRLLIFDDVNRNLLFDSQTESLAFYDSVLVPTARNSVRYDTISSRDTVIFHELADIPGHTDTLKIDSVVKVSETIFSPSALELLFFKPSNTIQFIKSSERSRREKLVLIFNQPLFDGKLRVELSDHISNGESLRLDLVPTRDTVTVWIADTSALAVDTLGFLVHYVRYDSLHNQYSHCDTIMPRYNIRKDRFKGFQSFKFAFSVRNGSAILPNGSVEFESSLPMTLSDASRVRLYTTVDTVGIKNRKERFYPIDTALIEQVSQLTATVRPRYTPDSAYSEQRVVQHRYVPNRFMIRFGLPIAEADFSIELSQMPGANSWCKTEFVAEENALYGWITDLEAQKFVSPKLIVRYRLKSGEQTEQAIWLRKGKEFKKRKSPRTSKQALYITKQQEESHYLDELLEIVFATPLQSIDTSMMSLILAGDTALASLPATFALDAKSGRKITVSYPWTKNTSYMLTIGKGSCVDISEETNREYLASVKTQGNTRHKITTPVAYTLKQDSLYSAKYRVSAVWNSEKNYRLVIADSAFVDLFGTYSDSTETDFTIFKPETLSNLEVKILNVPFPMIFEVMDGEMKKCIYRRYSSDTGQVVFSFGFIQPGTYGFRIIEDRDNSSNWTTGDYFKRIQPENIRFSKETIVTKANKDHYFTWDINKVVEDKPEDTDTQSPKSKYDSRK